MWWRGRYWRVTEEQWQRLAAGFQTYDLLDAVDSFDKVRYVLADEEDGGPPEIRRDLLKLHALGMAVVNEGDSSKSRQLFELADDLSLEITDLVAKLESVQEVLDRLLEFAPQEDDED